MPARPPDSSCSQRKGKKTRAGRMEEKKEMQERVGKHVCSCEE